MGGRDVMVEMVAQWLAEQAALRDRPGDYGHARRCGRERWRSYLPEARKALRLIAVVESERD